MKFSLVSSIVLSTLALLSGCGSEVQDLSSNPEPITGAPSRGIFISRTEGLEYTRTLAPIAQLTDEASQYAYRTGEVVNFHIGNLDIGEAIGLSIITPKDIVAYENLELDTSIYAPEVNNRVRLLMALDSDNILTNGIQISQAIRDAAASWGKVDYAGDENTFTTVLAEATGNAIQLDANQSKAKAEEFFAESLRCVYSGAYTGYRIENGLHVGFVGVMIQSSNTQDTNSSLGTIVALSDGQELDGNSSTEEYLFARGEHNMDTGSYTFSETGEFKDGGIVPSDANVTGDGISIGYNKVTGTFRQLNPQTQEIVSGAYAASRAYYAKDSAYRYTGYARAYTAYPDQNESDKIRGLFTFDINRDGTIEGMVHDAADNREPTLLGKIIFDDSNISAIGSVDMNLTYDDGTRYMVLGVLKSDGDVNLDIKDLNNTYVGYLEGIGCQLQQHK